MTLTPSRYIQVIRWILLVSIILCCLGYVINTLRYSDRVFTILWSEHYLNTSETFALRVSEWGALGMLAAACAAAFRPLRGLQVAVFLWLALSVACRFMVELWHPGYLVGASAIRVGSPLLFLLLPADPAGLTEQLNRTRILEWGMRLAIASTFFFHGHECLAGKAQFLDFIHAFVRLIGIDGISSASALTALKVIGIVDILVAIAILIPVRLYWVAGWMAFWGLATGYARIMFAGWQAYPELLLRIIHGTLPVCLIFLWLAIPSARRSIEK